jgi:hypothetical protein
MGAGERGESPMLRLEFLQLRKLGADLCPNRRIA